VTAATADVHSGVVDLTWQNVDNDGNADEPFATANIYYGDASEWLLSWVPIAHLVHSRIKVLEDLAAQGKANRFSRNMAYTLFASNLVTYADKYRGMQSVVMHELEGFADIQLTTQESGVWTVPPYFIDSVAHLAGFIMNCSDSIDAQNYYCVTPGWNAMKFAKPLTPGAKYRSYVKMIPTAEDPTIYFGDVYIMQDDIIVGVVNGIQFRRYPRILLNRFFSPPDKMAAIEGKPKPTVSQAPVSVSAAPPAAPKTTAPGHASGPESNGEKSKPSSSNPASAMPATPAPSKGAAPAATAAAAQSNNAAAATASGSISARAILLIANEAGLELSDMEDGARFADLGVDSLMSLVISEKFRTELDVKVSGSLFLDYETIGDLREWLDEYYS
jgi:acyl carrier protein